MTALFGVSPPHFRQRRVIERVILIRKHATRYSPAQSRGLENPAFFPQARARAIIVTKNSFGTSTAAFTV